MFKIFTKKFRIFFVLLCALLFLIHKYHQPQEEHVSSSKNVELQFDDVEDEKPLNVFQSNYKVKLFLLGLPNV